MAASVAARKRVPTHAPAAPSASTAARPRPSAIPPAATTGTGATVSTTRGTSASVETVPQTCPPASQPCATTTLAPAAAAARASSAVPAVTKTLAPLLRAVTTGSPRQSDTRLQRASRDAIHTVVATFCLIHGNWHDGSCWEPLVERLKVRGHDAVAPDLPFDDPQATYEDRARPASAALEAVEGPVVIVGHSVGSAEAALVAAERRPALLVYLCPRFGSFAAPPDAPPVFREGFPFPPRDGEGRILWDADAAVAPMYPDSPRRSRESWPSICDPEHHRSGSIRSRSI